MASKVKALPWTSAAKLFACTVISEQMTFFAYHTNSYATIPCMLKSDKPMVMRDVFLTKCTQEYPTPLPVLYCSTYHDLAIHCTTGAIVGGTVVTLYGAGHAVGLLFLGGFFSSGAYLFQSQINPSKNASKYDVSGAAGGAICALCSTFLMRPDPTRQITPMVLSVGTILWKLHEEYMLTPIRLRDRTDKEKASAAPEVHEFGALGGIFLGMIYFNLFLKTKADKAAVNQIFVSMQRQTMKKV